MPGNVFILFSYVLDSLSESRIAVGILFFENFEGLSLLCCCNEEVSSRSDSWSFVCNLLFSPEAHGILSWSQCSKFHSEVLCCRST